MRDYVLLYVNGLRHELRGSRVFQSVSDFLRYDLGLTGTKVVCAEGDCGSCTVMIGRAREGKIRYETVTCCIQYVYQLDGAHLVTVEGLKYDGELNPVQAAMVRCQGAQCGYCTPGFVVAMCSLFEADSNMTEKRLRRGLVGNLCRCTGYEPILKAGLDVNTAKLRRLEQIYPPEKILPEISKAASEEAMVQEGGKIFYKPTTVAGAVKFKSEHPDCVMICGGTDLGVQINKGFRELRTMMSLGGIESLRSLTVSAEQIVAGAGVSLTALEQAAVDALPEYGAMLNHFGSPPIKNAGTIGGNIGNGSPIGDTMPALFVLEAQIELTGVKGSRLVNMNDFYVAYKKSVAAEDEMITRVMIPLPGAGEIFKLYKVSKRKDLDISSFTAAIWMKLNGETIEDIRIAYGGVGPNILRLRGTEAMLKDQIISEALFDDAAEKAASEIKPISDVRGSANYRSRLGVNILRKFYHGIDR